MNRVDRLFATLLALKEGRLPRASELAQEFEVSERTIYRDLRDLDALGIHTATLHGEGYTLSEGFHLPPVMLSAKEALTLYLSGLLFGKRAGENHSEAIEAALSKIGATLPPVTREMADQLVRVLEYFPPHARFDAREPYMREILEALEHHQVLHVSYRRPTDDMAIARDFEPHQLHYSASGLWYVTGYDRLRNDIRSFRLTRIQSLKATGEIFEPRIMLLAPGRQIEVRVRFHPFVLAHVRERQHYTYHHDEPGGVMVYRVGELREIQSWIFGFGAHAEVLSPRELRDSLKQEAERLLQKLA